MLLLHEPLIEHCQYITTTWFLLVLFYWWQDCDFYIAEPMTCSLHLNFFQKLLMEKSPKTVQYLLCPELFLLKKLAILDPEISKKNIKKWCYGNTQ